MTVTSSGFDIRFFQILKTNSPESRQTVLRNAALIERLREELPGWVSRKIVCHTEGEGLGHWPLAIVHFRAVPSEIQDNAVSKPEQNPTVSACIWRVRVNTNETRPQLVLSAANFDHTGFRPVVVEENASRKIRQKIAEHWQEADLATDLSQLTLLAPVELESWFEERVKSARLDLKSWFEDQRAKSARLDSVSLDQPDPIVEWFKSSFPSMLPLVSPVEEKLLFDVDSSSVHTVDHAHGKIYQRLRSLIGDKVAADAKPLPDLKKEADAWLGRLALFRRPTRFYPGYSLYRLRRTWSQEASTQLVKEGYVVAPDYADVSEIVLPEGESAADTLFAVLDGSSPPIHQFNRILNESLCITRETALDYLKFFCEFVHGDEGAFYVLEGGDGLSWSDTTFIAPERLPILCRKMQAPFLLDTLMQPPSTRVDKFLCIATLHYGRATFFALFNVHSSGTIDMIYDHPLSNRLPTKPHAWNDQSRLFASHQSDGRKA